MSDSFFEDLFGKKEKPAEQVETFDDSANVAKSDSAETEEKYPELIKPPIEEKSSSELEIHTDDSNRTEVLDGKPEELVTKSEIIEENNNNIEIPPKAEDPENLSELEPNQNGPNEEKIEENSEDIKPPGTHRISTTESTHTVHI